MSSLLRFALLLTKTVGEGVRIENEKAVVSVRPYRSEQRRCPVCGRKCKAYDARGVPRRWRALDLAASMCFLEYRVARVRCPEHGAHAERVPWARHKARFTRSFEDRVAWMAAHCTMSAAATECRIEWKSVGGVCSRVYGDLLARRGQGRFGGLARIGIDETSYKKGHRYIMVVVDHDTGRLVWAGEGHGRETLKGFFDRLTREQRRAIEVVTADGAKWIKELVKGYCPHARWVMDPFHVVSWMNDAVDGLRCEEWQRAKNAARAALPKRPGPGRPRKGEESPPEAKALKERADAIKGSKFPLVKGKESLTDAQRAKLEDLKRTGSRLFRAWELKEDLRAVFMAADAAEAKVLLDDWIRRAGRCRIERVVEVEKKVRCRREDIVRAVEFGISNARVEAVNNKIKVTVRMGYGFRNVDNMISLLMLRCSNVKPQLPGRAQMAA